MRGELAVDYPASLVSSLAARADMELPLPSIHTSNRVSQSS